VTDSGTALPSALADRAWPSLPPGQLLAIPLGSTEQHGPHLPVGTDTLIATALADGLARRRDDVLVAPALPFGASGEHAGFPGTLSLGSSALRAVLIELVRSADDTARGIVLINAHGGNTEALRSATGVLDAEGRRVLAWSPRAVRAGDLHAGWSETAVLRHLRPGTIPADPLSSGPSPTLAALQEHGVRALSPNGVLGDPNGATAEAGADLVDGWIADLADAVEQWALGCWPASNATAAAAR
jgi:mycofactocin system creatininase family protein